MDLKELAAAYRAKSDEELLLLAGDSEALMPEAQRLLTAELARRELGALELEAVAQEHENFHTASRGAVNAIQRFSPPRLLWFCIHVALVYGIAIIATPRLAYWTRDVLVPLLHPRDSSSHFEFLLSHLLTFSFIPGLVAGFVNARFRQNSALLAWIIPTAVLAYRLISFPSSASVLTHSAASPFHQYFGGGFHIPDFHDWHEFWTVVAPMPDYQRGSAQIYVAAPFYVAIAYSAGAWVAGRTRLHPIISEKVRQWESQRFQSR